MKQSKYNIICKLDDENEYVLYNTLYRKYIEFNIDEKCKIEKILKNLEKESFNVEDKNYLVKIAQIGGILPNIHSELNELRVLYNEHKFDSKLFSLVLSPTLNCNFRCTYCYENHSNERFNDNLISNVVKLVDKKSKEVNKLQVAWFGGEPMLEFNTIVHLSEKMKKICSENNCLYASNMTTNGFLFDEFKIKKLKDLNLTSVQITLDGINEFHNNKRHLIDGSNTYTKVKENCIKILENNINLKLRVNIDKENYDNIFLLLDEFPLNLRKDICIQLSNLFQEKEELNLYPLYKEAINKGYKFNDTLNTLVKCEAATPNSATIYPNGQLTFCSLAAEKNLFYGNLTSDGNLKIKDKSLFYNFNNISPFDIEKCNNCIQLPMCMGSCSLHRFKNKGKCTKMKGLSLEDRIKLHVYSDRYSRNL